MSPHPLRDDAGEAPARSLRGDWFTDPKRFKQDCRLLARAFRRNGARLDCGTAAVLVSMMTRHYVAHAASDARAGLAYLATIAAYLKWLGLPPVRRW